MKQKIYSLIILLMAILIFTSFSLVLSKEKNIDDFEVFIVNSTETSENVTCNTTVTSTAKTKAVHTSTKIKITETVKATSAVTVPETSSESESETETVNFPIDINTAGIDELKALDGIGDTIASAIIEYRETYGNFHNREELLNVSGIGEKKLAGIYDFIFVENETYDIPDDDDDTSEVFEEYYEEQPEESDNYQEESEDFSETEFIEETAEETSGNIMINLNTAGKDDLMKLPYVDEDIADDIIELRETIQYFSHPYELLMVESLTQQQVAEIIKFVTVQ